MTTLTRVDVEAALAQVQADGRPPSIRAVAAAIAASSGRRPSFSTISRLLAEIRSTQVAETPPPPVLAQQFTGAIPEIWRQALDQARAAVAADVVEMERRHQEAVVQVRELQDLLDDAQAARTSADEAAAAAETREQALLGRVEALTASLDHLHATWRTQEAAGAARQATLTSQLQAALLAIERERQAAAVAHAAMQAADERRAALDQDLTAERGTAAHLRMELSETQQRLAETRVYVANLTDAGRMADVERADLRNQVLDLTRRLAAAEQQARDGSAERDRTAEQLRASQARAEDDHVQCELLRAQHDLLRAEQERLVRLVDGVFSVRPVALAAPTDH